MKADSMWEVKKKEANLTQAEKNDLTKTKRKIDV